MLQTILTLIVADEHVLNLPIRTQVSTQIHSPLYSELMVVSVQFVVYSGYYFVLTLIFVGAGVYKLTVEGCLRSLRLCCKETPPPQDTEPHPSSQDHTHMNIQGDEDNLSIHSTDKLIL